MFRIVLSDQLTGTGHAAMGGIVVTRDLRPLSPSGVVGRLSAPQTDERKESGISDDPEQTPPSNWTGKGGMVPQQESANDWAKEIAEAAQAREQGSKDKALEHGQNMGR